MNFIKYIFSKSKIIWTLIINFIGIGFYYELITKGTDSFYVSNAWISVEAVFIAGIVFIYWVSSYRDFKNNNQ